MDNEIKNVLENGLPEEEKRKKFKSNVHKNDGKSLDEIFQELEEILGLKRNKHQPSKQ
ncbi:MAG: hypothetical protein IJ217_04495 [Clostridia bacterium]|nr:hypothetical protein [Clostridia bacterium]